MNEKLFKIFLLQFQKYVVVVVVVVVRCQHSNARFKLGNSVQWRHNSLSLSLSHPSSVGNIKMLNFAVTKVHFILFIY